MKFFTALLIVLLFSIIILRNTDLVIAQSSEAENLKSEFSKLPGTVSAYAILPDGTIVAQNENLKQPAFSTIKLWVAAAAFEEATSGRFNLEGTCRVAESDKVGGTGEIQNQTLPKDFSCKDLLRLMLTKSDNIATNVLVNTLSMQKINSFIQSHGYSQTELNRLMTKSTSTGDNQTSAKDAVSFLTNLVNKSIAGADQILELLSQRNTVEDPQFFYITKGTPQSSNFFGKSGVGPGVKNDAVILHNKAGGQITVSILLSKLSNDQEGISSMSRIGEMLYNTSTPPINPGLATSSTQALSGGGNQTFCTKVGNPSQANPCPGPQSTIPPFFNTNPNPASSGFVYYCQGNTSWQNTCSLGNAGCGPASLAMVISTLGPNKMTPVEVDNAFHDNRFRACGNVGSQMTEAAGALKSRWLEDLGFEVGELIAKGGILNTVLAKKYLDAGNLIIGSSKEFPCSNCKSATVVDHIFVVDGLDIGSNTISIRDPNNCSYQDGDDEDQAKRYKKIDSFPWYYAYPIKYLK